MHRRPALASLALYAALGLGAFVMLAPLAWMLLTSLKTYPEILRNPPAWLPARPQWGNYATVLGGFAYYRFFLNSVFVAVMVIAGTILTCCPAAYAFAFYETRFKGLIFGALLSTLMLPAQVTVIPLFRAFAGLGWVDTYLPLIVPAWLGGNVFGIFLLRQFFRTIPRSFLEAARIDGASEWTILWQLVVPMSRPAVLTVAVFTFLWSWNDLFNPLVYLQSESLATLPVGLLYFIARAEQLTGGSFGQVPWHLVMALAAVMVAPVVLVFVLVQRRFVESVASSGVKG
ncbi:MAG: carbohydrate ABC transporter permease [Verrucomicrobia bacterium]|nr:carbohydrate ABC transporter permease [Verrucomicrobiota bacterium]